MKIHKIEKNETLESIAKKYNITIANIIEDNNIKDRKRLGVGNTLKIREKSEDDANGAKTK